MTSEDLTWLALAAQGDPNAFARFCTQHAARLTHTIIRKVGAVDEAEDVVLHVFVELSDEILRGSIEHDPRASRSPQALLKFFDERTEEAIRGARPTAGPREFLGLLFGRE